MCTKIVHRNWFVSNRVCFVDDKITQQVNGLRFLSNCTPTILYNECTENISTTKISEDLHIISSIHKFDQKRNFDKWKFD